MELEVEGTEQARDHLTRDDNAFPDGGERIVPTHNHQAVPGQGGDLQVALNIANFSLFSRWSGALREMGFCAPETRTVLLRPEPRGTAGERQPTRS